MTETLLKKVHNICKGHGNLAIRQLSERLFLSNFESYLAFFSILAVETQLNRELQISVKYSRHCHYKTRSHAQPIYLYTSVVLFMDIPFRMPYVI